MAEIPFNQQLLGNKWEEHEVSNTVTRDLYTLSEMLGCANPNEQAHGILGGEWGYGQDFSNNVFEMHPYWWGDCECGFEERSWAWEKAHEHGPFCYQQELERERVQAELPPSWGSSSGLEWEEERRREEPIYRALTKKHGLPYEGCAVHCTCSYEPARLAWLTENGHDPICGVVLPNFLHKPSGYRVHWYKYIGRGMTANQDLSLGEWQRLYDECRTSLKRNLANE